MLSRVVQKTVRTLVPLLRDGADLSQRLALDTLKFSPETVIRGYLNGYFPLPEKGRIRWRAPKTRAVIPVDEFHIPKNVKRLVRQQKFEVRFDTAFGEVIRGCADRSESWINDAIISVYTRLHEAGVAHSVEAWQDGELVGGLYGVRIGSYFATESQFHRVRDAGKVAFVSLFERLNSSGFQLHDVQSMTPYLSQFGAIEVSDSEFAAGLMHSVIAPSKWETYVTGTAEDSNERAASAAAHAAIVT